MKKLLLFFSLLQFSAYLQALDSELIVQIKQGYIRGTSGLNNVRKFLGIPFAKPPVGLLRWNSPQDTENWDGIKDAVAPGPPCPQILLGIYTNEDCLYLNVYTPATPATTKKLENLPVLVWIFGGGFAIGDGYEYGLYDAESFVNQEDVIVVTFNYRVGIFGTIALEDLKGNFGFEDQRKAFQWVKQNIVQFGGNPDNVTLFGESAGAMSIAAHMTSKLSEGLFSKVIMMSNPFGLHWKSIQQAKDYGRRFLENSACKNSKCLFDLPAWKVMAFQPILPDLSEKKLGDVLVYSPFIDHIDIVDNPMKLLISGNFTKIPVIIGTTRDETSFIESMLSPLRLLVDFPAYLFTFQFYKHHIKAIFGSQADKVLLKYPPHLFYETNYQSFLKLTSSLLFTCPSWKVAKSVSQLNLNSYFYELNLIADYLPFGICAFQKVCHAVDLAYTFGKIPFFGSSRLDSLLRPDPTTNRNSIIMNLQQDEYISLIEELFGESSLMILKCFPPKNGLGNFENLARLENIFNGNECHQPFFQFVDRSGCSVESICNVFKFIGFQGFFKPQMKEQKALGFSKSEKKLISFIFSKFASFSKGNINDNTEVEWPRMDLEKKQYLFLADPIKIQSDLRKDECDFWDEIGYEF